jgi:hypothetical protein
VSARPARQPFLQAVLSELTWRKFAIAQGVALAFFFYHYFDLATAPAAPPRLSFLWSTFILAELSTLSIFAAAMCAMEAVHRGVSAWIIFPSVILLASVFTGVTQWYIRDAFRLQVVADDYDPLKPHRRYGHMLIVALYTSIYGACIMLVYVDRMREIEWVLAARNAELRRTQIERELMYSNLLAVRARIEPEQVIVDLARIQDLYARKSPEAERALDELVQELRARTLAAAPPAVTAIAPQENL